MKLIREARMGAPKTFKTGAICGTYPKPLLYFGFDRGGLDVILTKGQTQGKIAMDVAYDEILFVKPTELAAWVAKPSSEQPKILAIDFTLNAPRALSMDLRPIADQTQRSAFISTYNVLTNRPELPWRTVVMDSVTGYTDCILSYISSFNPNAMSDARQWASQAGGEVRKTILSMTCLPCHVVVLLHSVIEKNETTGALREQPSVYSQVLRDDFFGLFSQVFYATKNAAGEPLIWVSDRYPVAGIGPRWPQGLPLECKPDFKSIYGNETE